MRLLIALIIVTAVQAQSGYLTYPTGSNPNGVTTVDLNGDGKPDLVIANSTSNSLTVILNTGNGTFAAPATITFTGDAATLGPRAIVAADVNKDKKLDLVVAGYRGLAVLLGKGDGTFQPPSLAALSAADVTVADVNGDGNPDLVLTYLIGGNFIPTGAALSILTGAGDGTFQQGPVFNVGFTPWAVPGIGDFNGDGKPDIAVAVGHGLVIFLNDGKGNFQANATNQLWNFAPGIVTGDFNGDGVTDLAVSGQTTSEASTGTGQGSITVLLGKGDGTFQTLPRISTLTVAETLAVADLNSDGHLDLIAGLSPPAFFAGRGDGTFATGIQLGTGTSGYVTIGQFSGAGLNGAAGTNSNGNVVILPRIVFPSLSLQNLSAAAFGLGPMAPGSIAAAFGPQLATQTGTVSNSSLPLTLGGDTVTVTASDGQVLPAQLYYVSPTQVNYVIPAAAATGFATVTINSNGSPAATGLIDIEKVAPALFTLNAANLAAANVIRVGANGQQTFLPDYTFDSAGNVVPLPIDLSSATDNVYLILYGTGIRNGTASNVTATISGVSAQVSYAGFQADYPGLDQVNILIPKSIVSTTSYTTSVQLTVAGQPSNPVRVVIQ